jgi:hypothetical protein
LSQRHIQRLDFSLNQGLPVLIPFQSQHDYMNDWLPKRMKYLRTITLQDHLPDATCSQCSDASGYWRCEHCLIGLPVCWECCRLIQCNMPFHRIQYWNRMHYERGWLCNLGVVMWDPCPQLPSSQCSEHVSNCNLPGCKHAQGTGLTAQISSVSSSTLTCSER